MNSSTLLKYGLFALAGYLLLKQMQGQGGAAWPMPDILRPTTTSSPDNYGADNLGL